MLGDVVSPCLKRNFEYIQILRWPGGVCQEFLHDGVRQMSGPLQGLKVLDLSRVLAGPWASQLLADYGAEVIKVERPEWGDDTRRWGPPWLRDESGDETGESAYFLSTNRNKRSITVDLGHPGGQEITRNLVAQSDILLENFKVGSLHRFGLHAAAMRELNRRLVYCSISAYGQSGSKSAEPGYDAMMQAAGGLMSLTGMSAEEGGGPQKVGVAISDIMTGMYAATAILAAVIDREKTGVGQHIDLSLYDCQVAWLANQNMNYLIGGSVPQRFGNAHPNIVPYQSFETADGYLMLAVGNDRQFAECADCLGLSKLADDPKFRSNSTRIENRTQLIEIIEGRIKQQSTKYWIELFAARQVPAGPINDLADIFTADFAAERKLLRDLDHPLAGNIPSVANPVRFSETPVEYRYAPPLLGQHTVEVLREDLGYDDSQIQSLIDSGAV